MYAKVTGFFGSYPKKVPCIIRGRRNDANGVTMSVPGRIDLYLTAPIDHFLGARSQSWLRVLLTHELTHFVHQTMDTGIPHDLSLVFGADFSVVGMDLLPGWAVEGPAVYDETRFSEGGRGRNPLFEVFTKAAAEEGDLFTLRQSAYASAFPPGGRIYVAGYALIDWLVKTYGEDSFRRIMDEYLDSFAIDFFGAMRKVTGKDAAAVFADMRKSLVARYAAQTAIPGGRLITPERIGSWTRPQPTVRGLYLFHASPEGYPAIVGWNPSTGEETVLVRADLTDDSSFCATRDGGTVWFSSLHWDLSRSAEPRSTADLYMLDAATGKVKQVTTNAHLWHPAVSADGTELVAVQGQGPYSRLVWVDTRTGAMRVLFSRAEANVYTPALSPDGRKVAFTFNLRGFQDVCVADLASLKAGSVPLDDPEAAVTDINADQPHPVLGPDPAAEYFPSFRDDATLLFTSDRSGSLALYSAELSSGAVSLVEKDPVAAIQGVADGDTLLYSSYATTGYCIKSVPFETLTPEHIESSPALPYPEPIQWTGTSFGAKAYFDWAPPLMWLPNVALGQTGPGSTDVAVGLGASIVGGSLLGASGWQLDGAWLLGADQPLVSLTASVSLGPVDLGLSSALTYQYAGNWSESLDSRATLSWSPVSQSSLGSFHSLTLSLGLAHSMEVNVDLPFTFAQSLSELAPSWNGTLAVPLQVRWQWSRRGGSIDFNAPAAVDVSLQGTTFLPLLSLTEFQEQALLYSALNIPSPFPHQVIKLGLKAAQYIGNPHSEYLDAFTVPRGFPGARMRTQPGGMLGSMDYLVPVALLDQPLPFGFAITALGTGFHLEALADFDAAAPAFSVLPHIFAGADVTLNLVWGGFSFPLGIGVAVAVNTAAPGSFNPATDLGIYVFLGFDSFASAVRSGLPTARVQREP